MPKQKLNDKMFDIKHSKNDTVQKITKLTYQLEKEKLTMDDASELETLIVIIQVIVDKYLYGGK